MKRRILILDDDRSYLQSTRLLLEEAGYEVRTCGEITACLIAIQEFQPELLLLDLYMPFMDGDVFLPWLRTQRPELSVVLCTGVESVDRDFFRSLGVTFILFKPFGHEELFPVVEQSLPVVPSEASARIVA